MSRTALLRAYVLALACAFSVGVPMATAATRISSNTNCPSSDAVSLKLVGLLSAGGPEAASARVRAEGPSLFIEVATPGEATHQRTVPATGDCEARAEAAALIIAAWLDAMPAASPAAPGVPPRIRPAVPTGEGPSEASEEVESEPLLKNLGVQLGGAVLGLTDRQGADAGLALDAAARLGHFGLAFATSLTWPRGLDIAPGTVHYWRPVFQLTGLAPLYEGNWSLSAEAGAALALLLVQGTGFANSRSDYSVEWGAMAGLRVTRPWRGKTAWLTLGGILWPQGRQARISGANSTLDIGVPFPGWEVRLAVGLSWKLL